MAATVSAAPSGIERLVGPDELFFSTTDRRGVIRSGNSVFVRVSRFTAEELIGMPHSIVRHPDMPGGAYKIMWERLLAGRPMGAYVQNLAKDGSHYWVFATATPLGDGFLSVRMAPRSPLFDPARRVLAAARATEREYAQSTGLNRHAVAEIGAASLEQHLRALGFANYDDFILEALPAEVAARAHLVTAAYARPWERGPIGEIIQGAVALDGLLGAQVERLEPYRQLASRLMDAAANVLDMARRLDGAVAAAQRASETVAASAPVLLNVARVMAAPMRDAVAALEGLAPRLTILRGDVASLRFRIALASLHNDMVAAFAAEVADGVAPPAALHEVPLLCDALHEGVAEMTSTAGQVNAELRNVAEVIAAAGGRLDEFRRFLGQWRILTMRHRAVGALGDLLGPIDDEIAAGHGWMDLLRMLGRECQAAAVPIEPGPLEAQVARIRAASVTA